MTSVDTARLQSLLAYLVLHRNAPQPRQYLAFLLWPDSTESQARTNLRNLLHLLRHALPDADRFLHIGRQTLQWWADAPFTLDLATGTVTPLWPIDFSHTPIGLHFSGRAFRRPGWALVSTYIGGHPTDYTWMDDQVFAVELEPGGCVVRLAHTHSLVDEDQEHDYWAEPHASVDPDFTRVFFTSNWGRSGTGEVEMFMIALPPGWPERLPY